MLDENTLEYLPNVEYYHTTDMGLAAMLMTLNFSISAVDKTNPKRATFVFRDSQNLQEAISRYWVSNERKYFDNIRLLKNRLYSD